MSGGMDTPRGYWDRLLALEARFQNTDDETLSDIASTAMQLSCALEAQIRALSDLQAEQNKIADDATTEYLRRKRAER